MPDEPAPTPETEKAGAAGVPETLPVLPLVDTVLFPTVIAPILVGQERSLRLVRDAMAGNRLVALVAQRRPDRRPAHPDDLYRIGTLTRIHDPTILQDDALRVPMQGLRRIRLVAFERVQPYLVARVEPADERVEGGVDMEATVRATQEAFAELVAISPDLGDDLAHAARALTDPRRLAYLVASSAPLSTAVRQEVLEIDSAAAKLRLLLGHIQHEIEVRRVMQKIATETSAEMSRAQRQHILRKQMEAIQRELGEIEPERAEARELRERIEALPLPEEARMEAERELDRLERTPAASPEHGMIRTWLDWIAKLPWGRETGVAIDVARARAVLDEDHFDLDKVKDRIVEYLAVKRLRDERLAESAGERGSEPERQEEGERGSASASGREREQEKEGGKESARESMREGVRESERAREGVREGGLESVRESEREGVREGVGGKESERERGREGETGQAREGETGRERVRESEAGHLGESGGSAGEAPGAAERLRGEPILCFVGPPGVGKTSLGQSIARAMRRRFARMSLGGIHDEAEIRGHRRTYIGAMPGRILQAIARTEAADPVFMLDEVDKLGVGFHGDPSAALLEVLDPAQNSTFVDSYLGVPFDLSRVLFLCTANTTETIPQALLDRMEVLPLAGYTDEEKLYIARRYVVPKLVRAHGLRPGEVAIDDDAVRRIVRDYTRETGVRGLEREVATVLRKAALRISAGAPAPIRVTERDVPDFLGPPRFFDEVAERIDRPGVATGLAWTPVGGNILFVEAATMPTAEERLLLTGMLGDVMRESAQAALSYVRSNAERLGIDPHFFDGRLVHVHVPAGAIPKDGPSAGITIVTALVSLATGRPVRTDCAMTGEITLRGKVLPVGGIKEKVLAARRAGLETVLLPRRNEAALEDVPDEVRRSMRFVLVESAEQVLEHALAPPPHPERAPEAAPPVH